MTLLIFFLILPVFSFSPVAQATGIDDESLMIPEAFLELGPDGSCAILVDKASSKIEIYQKRGKDIIKVAAYRTSTGQNEGDKKVEGDLKTPEGVYYLVRIREDAQLLSKYGIRAFDLNYPNQVDRINAKTGHGIWLHGTDEPERLQFPRTSEGCVVVSNEDLKDISDYITLYRTPIIINDSVKVVSAAEVKNNRGRVVAFIGTWLEAWANQDYEVYKNSYSDIFRGSKKRTRNWLNRKKLVFESTNQAKIEISDLRVLKKDDYYTVSFYQRYKSNLMDDTGIKWVYLQDTEEGLRIISEEWFAVNKALKGQKWNRKGTKIVEVIEDIADIEIDEAGKLAILNPDFTFNGKSDTVSANTEFVDNKENSARLKTAENNVESPIAVEGFRFTGRSDSHTGFYLQLVNKEQGGEPKRGRLILVAEYENNKFSSFPEVELSSGIPVSSGGGDKYGIKWFKEMTATFRNPAGRQDLLNVRGYIFDEKGRLISDTELWKKQEIN